jgi:hypothetical protein
MRTKDIEMMIELAKKKLAAGITKEVAFPHLQRVGVIDENGEFTAPYQNRGRAVAANKIRLRGINS